MTPLWFVTHPACPIVATGMPATPVLAAPAHGLSELGYGIVIGPDRCAVLTPRVDVRRLMNPR